MFVLEDWRWVGEGKKMREKRESLWQKKGPSEKNIIGSSSFCLAAKTDGCGDFG